MYKGVTYLDISQPITTNTSDREVGPNSHTNVLVKSTRPVYTTENSVEGKALMQNLGVPNSNREKTSKNSKPL